MASAGEARRWRSWVFLGKTRRDRQRDKWRMVRERDLKGRRAGEGTTEQSRAEQSRITGVVGGDTRA